MKDIIYKQQYAGQCGSYACLNVLQRMGVKITEAEILSLGSMEGVVEMRRKLKKAGYIKDIYSYRSPIIVSNLLKRGVPLIIKINGNNFPSVSTYPHINIYKKGNAGHFVCGLSESEGLYKYIDQQGVSFGENGYGYINKGDLLSRRISIYRIIV